jgi:probable F420-dependent oxidoreductase
MHVYAAFDDPRIPLKDVAAYAQRAERIGFAGLLVPESVHDGFLTSLLALEHTRQLQVVTSVVLAFPRSPMTVAYAAWDLQSISGGRFTLGLGSQVKGNIVGRFGVEWKPPVARMRDYVGALRAAWSSFQSGAKLAFESQYYTLDRLQPFFNPGPIDYPDIPIFLGGVNPGMTRLAGAVADGFMTHPTNTSPRYLREVTRREMERGSTRAGRDPRNVQLIASTFVATGPTKEAVRAERERLREYLGFLYSTPQYWRTLDLHGWQAVGRRLHDLSREGRWAEMKAAIGDDILDALVASGTYEEITSILADWYGDLATGITLRMPDDPKHDEGLARVIKALSQPGKDATNPPGVPEPRRGGTP